MALAWAVPCIAYEWTKKVYDILTIDKRHVTKGNTSANTGLLQYSMRVDLAKQMGGEDTILFYRLCE